ncbi:NADP-dependent oxidoreductase [Streptomyces xiamenensis]|jgi:NADPH:quinone reductase-like Zn-dependent oxidoreductase|uniref:GroES-like protein n=1 Tax=Streptomyces xiamenensis TaxID=408015 RepID=A0A0F7FTF5_9ACTN|nr:MULTISPECIES: NADP-dependent oxidoreductase [Streptomyces]AKG42990.1 GroES-like protein [Streptomyces xiamenensis]MCU4745631.1 NADP-dependent oxidoreductase [Streptomyces sp. G-5]QQN79380.1 NADP-dependent oxidoreductase [Streptomyces sp. XC 2026]
MRALTYTDYGDPSVLRVTEQPEPHAGPGQVRIAVRAAAVNPIDWKIRRGLFDETSPLAFPAIPGTDAAGVVDEVGSGVAGVSVGDEVFGSGQSASAQYAVLDHYTVKPAELTWEQASGLPVTSETAMRALRLLGVTTGQTLLIEGAAGGVGSAAAQFAVANGITVIGTASDRNQDYLRSLGVLPTTYGAGLRERVAQLAPQGVDAVFDTAGSGSLPELIEIAGDPGRVVSIADFSAPQHGARVTSAMSDEPAYDALPQAADLAREGRFTVAIDSEYPLDAGAKAHERSEGGHVRGKIVLTV